MTEKKQQGLRHGVFWPPFILLIALVIIGFVNADAFNMLLGTVTTWILTKFAWLFSLNTLFCVLAIVIIYFSPLGKVRIGGSKARPMMGYTNLLWITLCTTIAAGILFWGSAEPLVHLYAPPIPTHAPGSPEAAIYAMEIMFLEWTWSPYALYTIGSIAFAFAFYNMKKPYSLGSMLYPALGDRITEPLLPIVDAICVFALVAGVSASLGTGTLTLSGGISTIFGVESSKTLWTILLVVIVAVFILSAVSGVMKGIRVLSTINTRIYLFIFICLAVFGPISKMLNLAVEGLGAYATDFFKLSLFTDQASGGLWSTGWPIFYWCNWLAWMPLSAAFLGRIVRGYTIKDAIKANFVVPAIFSTIWMGLFSTATLYYEMNGELLYNGTNMGPQIADWSLNSELAVYAVLGKIPFSMIIIPVYVIAVFISFVTAADSNTTSLAGLCSTGISTDDSEAKPSLKILWGITMGLVTFVMVVLGGGISGIKAASNLGGFPILFICIVTVFGMLKVASNPMKFDTYKEDYDLSGAPIPSPQLAPEDEGKLGWFDKMFNKKAEDETLQG